jgi:transcriptional regulator with XRE-family HTH domain
MATFNELSIAPVSPEDKRFFKEMGARIAQLRKQQNLTQQRLADELGMSQQIVASYEIGRRRIPVSTLPRLARTLGVSVEALIGEQDPPAKRGPTPKLQRHMQRISELPKTQQRFLLQMIETALAQAGR